MIRFSNKPGGGSEPCAESEKGKWKNHPLESPSASPRGSRHPRFPSTAGQSPITAGYHRGASAELSSAWEQLRHVGACPNIACASPSPRRLRPPAGPGRCPRRSRGRLLPRHRWHPRCANLPQAVSVDVPVPPSPSDSKRSTARAASPRTLAAILNLAATHAALQQPSVTALTFLFAPTRRSVGNRRPLFLKEGLHRHRPPGGPVRPPRRRGGLRLPRRARGHHCARTLEARGGSESLCAVVGGAMCTVC